MEIPIKCSHKFAPSLEVATSILYTHVIIHFPELSFSLFLYLLPHQMCMYICTYFVATDFWSIVSATVVDMCCTFIDQIKQHFIRKRNLERTLNRFFYNRLYVAHIAKKTSLFRWLFRSILTFDLVIFIRNSLGSHQLYSSLSCCYTDYRSAHICSFSFVM